MITGVARDDLPGGVVQLYAETCRRIRELSPSTGVELLVGGFRGHNKSIDMVIEAAPRVFARNPETVPRVFKKVCPAFRCERSLTTIRQICDVGMVTRSNLILRMDKTREEISEALHDLHSPECDLLTVTQYLRPSVLHRPIDRWVHPEKFLEIAAEAEEMGFAGVIAGPPMRSSYRVDLPWAKGMKARGFEIPARFAHSDNSASILQETSTVLTEPHERRERRAAVREKVGT